MSGKRRAPQAAIQQALSYATALLAARPDVTGIDVGPKYFKGKRTSGW